MAKVSYLLRSARNLLRPERLTCPNCGGSGDTIARKYLFSALKRCSRCKLQYRTPTDPPGLADRFYNEEYEQGQTTSLPTSAKLEEMKANDFAELENDYVEYARLLLALGVALGGRVFDYGCSWGYGSYLLAKAGFSVKSFELSRPRRAFGAAQLGVDLVLDFDLFVRENEGTFDAFFSSHVLEHVPAPDRIIEQAMRLLKPGGLFVGVFPNGSSSYRAEHPSSWRQLWGEVHPNFLDEIYLARVLAGFPYLLGSSPVTIGSSDLAHLSSATGERRLDPLSNYEMFVAARKT